MKEQTFQQRLVNVQSRLKANKSQYNSFGKYSYRNQEDILESVKPLLAENGLIMTISDEIIGDGFEGNMLIVKSTVTVSDGEKSIQVSACAGIDPNRKGMDIAQSFGSSSSYARKYALGGMFLIDDTKDADATNSHGKAASASVPTAKPVADKPSSSGTDVMFQKAVDRMKEVGTQAKYDEIMAAIGIQLSESQRNALSKFIKK
jgi:hypothetical protein